MPGSEGDVEIELQEDVAVEGGEGEKGGGGEVGGEAEDDHRDLGASLGGLQDIALLPFMVVNEEGDPVDEEDEDDAAAAESEDAGSSLRSTSFDRKSSFSTTERSAELSNVKAAFHIFKGNVGAAIFTLSSAYKRSGVVVGTIIILGLAVICVHCMMLLVQCKQELNNTHIQTYGQVASVAFGRKGKHLVDIFIVITQLGFCCAYYQFASGMLHSVMHPVSISSWISILVLPATLLSFLPNMKRLVPAAIFATAATILALVVTYGYDVGTLFESGLDPEVVPATGFWAWPICIGNTVSAFEGIGLVLPIENSVRDKGRFAHLLMSTFFLITALYISFGLMGYLAYASVLTNSITDVLPMEMLAGIVRCGMAVAILLTYPIQFFPAIQVIEGWLFVRQQRYPALQPAVRSEALWSKKLTLVWRNLLLRGVISVVLALMAITVGDQMSLFLALIGGMGGSALAVVIPPLLHLKLVTLNPQNAHLFPRSVSWMYIAKDAALCGFGVLAMCLATYVSILELLANLNVIDSPMEA